MPKRSAEQKTRIDTFRVTIRTSESLVWQGRASSLTAKNSSGIFDVLPDHANMITLIENEQISIVTETGTRKFTFKKAVLVVKENNVSIYANIASSDLDIQNLR